MARNAKITDGEAIDPPHKEDSRAYLRVAESIRLRILNDDIKPGDRLPNEIDLAREQGFGRTTVREALRLLASVGLVQIKRGAKGGAFVSHPTAENLSDLMTTALALMIKNGEVADSVLAEAIAYTMPMVARMASLRATEKEIEELEDILAELPKTGSSCEWFEVGRRFYSLMIDMSHNYVFGLILKPLVWNATSIPLEERDKPGWRRGTAACYSDLAHAIRRRAPAAAEEAMSRLRQRYVPAPQQEA